MGRHRDRAEGPRPAPPAGSRLTARSTVIQTVSFFSPRRPDHARVPGAHRQFPHARVLGGGARDRLFPSPQPLCRDAGRAEISGGGDHDTDDHDARRGPALPRRPRDVAGSDRPSRADHERRHRPAGSTPISAAHHALASDYLGGLGIDVEGLVQRLSTTAVTVSQFIASRALGIGQDILRIHPLLLPPRRPPARGHPDRGRRRSQP